MVDSHPPNDRQSKSRIPEGDISGFISANYPGARWEAIEFACDRIEQSLQKGNYVLPLMVADNFKISSHKDALYARIAVYLENQLNQTRIKCSDDETIEATPNDSAYEAIIEHCRKNSKYFRQKK